MHALLNINYFQISLLTLAYIPFIKKYRTILNPQKNPLSTLFSLIIGLLDSLKHQKQALKIRFSLLDLLN